jgi:hypothetical protein
MWFEALMYWGAGFTALVILVGVLHYFYDEE